MRARLRAVRGRAHDDALAVLRYHRTGLYSVAVVVGLVAGAGAIAFRLAIDAWSHLLAAGAGEAGSPAPTGGVLAFSGGAFVLLAPIVSGLVVGPVMTWLGRTSTGHGVSGVIWSARRCDGAMPLRPALASVASAAVTIGGGGSVGPEGPIAELGASAASSVGRRLGLPVRSVRMLAAAGTAAGIASAFHAPLAGAFFAMEVILLDFTIDAFAFMVLACVASTVLTHQVLGQGAATTLPALEVAPAAVDASLGWAAILGVLGGVLGVLFSRARYLAGDAVARLRLALRVPAWLAPGLGGVVVGAVLLVLPECYGESSLVLDRVLDGSYTAGAALGLAVAKLGATVLTLAVGFAGGVFAPSLFIGAATGAAFGALIQPDVPHAPALFGVLGMCAVFTGAGRAPITAVILIIEMTGQYSLLLPLMLVSVLATFVSRLLTRTSIYTEELRRRGDDIDDPLASSLVGRVDAGDIMTAPPAVLDADDSLEHAAAVLRASGSSRLPVTERPSDSQDPTALLLGCVSAVQVAEAVCSGGSRALRVGDLALSEHGVDRHEDATSVLGVLVREHVDAVPVVRTDQEGRRVLVGWVCQEDMVRRLYRHQRDAADASRQRTSLGARAQRYWRQRRQRRSQW